LLKWVRNLFAPHINSIDRLHIEYKDIYAQVSRRKKICLDFLMKTINKPWDFQELSKNPKLTYAAVYNKSWDWRYIYITKNI
jgi:hypothetical protein